MTFSIGRREKKTAGKKNTGAVIFSLVALTFVLLAGLSRPIRRQLEIAAADKAETLLSEAAAKAMEAAFRDGGSDTDGIVTLSRAPDGTVTSVETAPGAITKLSSAFQSKLRELLADSGKVTIPSGNLTGSAFLSGRGFPIAFKTVLTHAAVTNIRSEFTAVGINQTLHRVILETRAAVTVLLPGRNVTREIVGSFPAAETVIVGRVPDVVLQPGQ